MRAQAGQASITAVPRAAARDSSTTSRSTSSCRAPDRISTLPLQSLVAPAQHSTAQHTPPLPHHATTPPRSTHARMQHPGEGGRRPRILLAVTGSVATIKLPLLAALLAQLGELRLAATSAARTFVHLEQLPPGLAPPAGDEDEWRDWAAVGDPVLHIELRRWADVFVVAPLSANSLAKLAQGLCDNLVTCVARAWDFRRPLLVAPAMNTFMWDSPFTGQHLGVLRQLGVTVIDPVAKALACGDVGNGAMAAPETVAHAVAAALQGAGFVLQQQVQQEQEQEQQQQQQQAQQGQDAS